MTRLGKKPVFDSPPRTNAPLWWTNNGILLLFLQCTIQHSYVFGQHSHTTTTFCSKLGVSVVEYGEVGQYICLWSLSQDSCASLMNKQWVFIGILIMCNPAWLRCWLKQPQNYSILLQNRGNFAPNYGLVLLGYGKVGQETSLWFPSQDSCTFIMN